MRAAGSGAAAPPAAPLPPTPHELGPQPRLRVLSFNVNGLRACLKRLKCTMAQLLQQLDADVICFQETKLRRGDVDSELACVDGWDSFFSCDATSSTGYSGTATYCRTDVALPFAAEEGFTGCAALASAGTNGMAAAMAAACPHPALAGQFSTEELAELDAEGRAVVTDHGAFVLFNLYIPAITAEDEERAEQRFHYKQRFLKALELRWRDLRRQGRAVVAVGDFNICPAPMDRADELDAAQHYRCPIRRWLRHLLHGSAAAGNSTATPGGSPRAGWAAAPTAGWQTGSQAQGAAAGVASAAVADHAGAACLGSGGGGASGGEECRFVDTFRHFYPARTDVATCWSTVTNARVNDYGSRIDLMLTAGLSVGAPPQRPAEAPQGAWPPSCAPLSSSSSGGTLGSASNPPGAGVGGAAAVWVACSEIWKQQEGSDHCPVFADFVSTSGAAFPCSAKAPATAMRHVFVGKQHKLHRWLAPVQQGAAAPPADSSCNGGSEAAASQQQQTQQQQQATAVGGVAASSQASRLGSQGGGSQPGGSTAAAGAKKEGKKQVSLKSFFQLPAAQTAVAQQQQQQQEQPASPQHQHHQQQQQQPASSPQQQQDAADAADDAAAAEAAAVAEAAQAAKVQHSKEAWAGLMAKNKPPLCRHKEPAALLKVNKSGTNKGRWFYTCARAAGPPPEGKCNYFKWVEKKAGDHQLTTLGGNGGGSSGAGGGKKAASGAAAGGALASKRLKS